MDGLGFRVEGFRVWHPVVAREDLGHRQVRANIADDGFVGLGFRV